MDSLVDVGLGIEMPLEYAAHTSDGAAALRVGSRPYEKIHACKGYPFLEMYKQSCLNMLTLQCWADHLPTYQTMVS